MACNGNDGYLHHCRVGLPIHFNFQWQYWKFGADSYTCDGHSLFGSNGKSLAMTLIIGKPYHALLLLCFRIEHLLLLLKFIYAIAHISMWKVANGVNGQRIFQKNELQAIIDFDPMC